MWFAADGRMDWWLVALELVAARRMSPEPVRVELFLAPFGARRYVRPATGGSPFCDDMG